MVPEGREGKGRRPTCHCQLDWCCLNFPWLLLKVPMVVRFCWVLMEYLIWRKRKRRENNLKYIPFGLIIYIYTWLVKSTIQTLPGSPPDRHQLQWLYTSHLPDPLLPRVMFRPHFYFSPPYDTRANVHCLPRCAILHAISSIHRTFLHQNWSLTAQFPLLLELIWLCLWWHAKERARHCGTQIHWLHCILYNNQLLSAALCRQKD